MINNIMEVNVEIQILSNILLLNFKKMHLNVCRFIWYTRKLSILKICHKQTQE